MGSFEAIQFIKRPFKSACFWIYYFKFKYVCMHIYLLTEHSIWIDRLVANSCDAIVSTQNLISTFPDPVRAKQVKQGCVNLFELRAHLLSRQCSLLQALDKINSLPRRGVQMIGRVIKEARSLHVCPFETYYTQFDLN